MNKDQFYTYLNNPDDLNESSLLELNEILEEYPYFQTAHLLYLKNLYQLKHLKFTKQLRVSSTYLADREVLFNFLYSNTSTDNSIVEDKRVEKEDLNKNDYSIDELEAEIKLPITKNTKQKIGKKNVAKKLKVLTSTVEQKNRKKRKQSNKVDSSKTHSFNEWLEIFSNKKDNSNNDVKLEKEANKSIDIYPTESSKTGIQNKLIADFINSNPRIEVSISDKTVNKDISEESNADNDYFITETLAKIYVEQKHYGKAINAYEKLSLKYPKKNIYFANQIKKIIKLINE